MSQFKVDCLLSGANWQYSIGSRNTRKLRRRMDSKLPRKQDFETFPPEQLSRSGFRNIIHIDVRRRSWPTWLNNAMARDLYKQTVRPDYMISSDGPRQTSVWALNRDRPNSPRRQSRLPARPTAINQRPSQFLWYGAVRWSALWWTITQYGRPLHTMVDHNTLW